MALRPKPFGNQRFPANGWSIYGAQGRNRWQPRRMGRAQNHSNGPIRNRWQTHGSRFAAHGKEGSAVRVRKRRFHSQPGRVWRLAARYAGPDAEALADGDLLAARTAACHLAMRALRRAHGSRSKVGRWARRAQVEQRSRCWCRECDHFVRRAPRTTKWRTQRPRTRASPSASYRGPQPEINVREQSGEPMTVATITGSDPCREQWREDRLLNQCFVDEARQRGRSK
jgi:hypothetical protein